MSKEMFNKLVVPHEKNFVTVRVPQEKIDKIKGFIGDLIAVKKKESHHKIDNRQEEKRWLTGFSGEAACEELLGVDIIDWNIGQSSKFHVSDLKAAGYDVGVKTVEWGKFHVIFKTSRCPQLMVFKMSENEFKICGIANKACLNSCQDINLILSPLLRRKGTKTAFTGYGEVAPISGIGDLSEFKLI